MNILSLFDGMSCGQIALDKLGIPVTNYFASEIDKYAIEIAKKNYPSTIHLGDVTQVKGDDLPQIDLLIGGSPCQGFSFAGKQLNFDDPRSKLFFEFVRLLKETKPKYFLLENVKMKKEYQDVISQHLGVEPIEINSALVSAQNRKRLYWTNIPNVTQPEDKGIILRDILEDGDVDRDKNLCLDANYHKGGNLKQYFEKHRRQLVFNDVKCGAFRGHYLVDGKRQDHKMKTAGLTEQRLEIRKDDKTNTLTTVQKDNQVVYIGDYNPVFKDNYCQFDVSGKGHNSQQDRAYYSDKKHGCLGASRLETKTKVMVDELHYRKLTPIECERLQTVDKVEILLESDLCIDLAKNLVNVVNQSPRLQKLALSAEKSELKESVKIAIKNMNANHQLIKPTAHQNVDTQTPKPTRECTNRKLEGQSLNADNAEKKIMSKHQEIEGHSATQNVFINIIEGKIHHNGKVESHRKEGRFTEQKNGKVQLKMSGKEIMQLVKDVENYLNTKKINNFTYTTLNRLNIKSLEQLLVTLYCFAENVITGYIQGTIKIKTLLSEGYTFGVSNSQRYKMLGNGWTVDVIAHIFKGLK